jgi:hypothetical protein
MLIRKFFVFIVRSLSFLNFMGENFPPWAEGQRESVPVLPVVDLRADREQHRTGKHVFECVECVGLKT